MCSFVISHKVPGSDRRSNLNIHKLKFVVFLITSARIDRSSNLNIHKLKFVVFPTSVGGRLISTYDSPGRSVRNTTNFSWWSFNFNLRQSPALCQKYHQLQLVVV